MEFITKSSYREKLCIFLLQKNFSAPKGSVSAGFLGLSTKIHEQLCC